MKPDLIINANTTLEDVIELYEEGKDKLYSINTICIWLNKNGYTEIANLILHEHFEGGKQ
jgi:hypothetical protein